MASTGGDPAARRRRSTTTSNFGVSRRESHDASGFYGRFRPPEVATDDTVKPPDPVAEPFVCGDARRMDTLADGSVALVVTSPPYFAGKQYEEELERDGVPASYLEYLEMLRDVFAECARVLEPGGRLAVNVANLGRKPYRSLSADVIRILQDDLGLLLRGEVVWQKAEGASGSCAWGSYRSATNPVLRDITERVVIASKGRFDRALSVKKRQAAGLPHRSTIATDDFMALTLDVWDIPPESARRVGHPAPFPVELPEKLVQLYTFEGDLVLDPFTGSGSTLVAAARTGRRFVGYDLDPAYLEIARQRVDAALAARERVEGASAVEPESRASVDAAPQTTSTTDDEFRRRADAEGKAAQKLAAEALEHAGFTVVGTNRRIPRTGAVVNLVATDGDGSVWFFDVPGAWTSHRGGLLRTDAVWKALGRATVLGRQQRNEVGGVEVPVGVVLLTTHLPKRGGEGDNALRAAGPGVVFDVIEMLSTPDLGRLRAYAEGGQAARPLCGYWSQADLERFDLERGTGPSPT